MDLQNPDVYMFEDSIKSVKNLLGDAGKILDTMHRAVPSVVQQIPDIHARVQPIRLEFDKVRQALILLLGATHRKG